MELNSTTGWASDAWIIAGDFNVVRRSWERNKGEDQVLGRIYSTISWIKMRWLIYL